LAMKVAVLAHSTKTLGGGLPELRRVLDAAGIHNPVWIELAKSKQVAGEVERVLRRGVELIIAWGGDGMVQRCLDAIGDAKVRVAVIPAGTSNLLASSLGIPKDIEAAVQVALHGAQRRLDVGRFDGERFAVMPGAGFDAEMIRDADRSRRASAVRPMCSAAPATLARRASRPGSTSTARAGTGGRRAACWWQTSASCSAASSCFDDAAPDDGLLDLGVVTADGRLQMARTVLRTALGGVEKSPFIRTTKARTVRVRLDRKVRYELDGGDRRKTKSFKISVEPAAVTICVPAPRGGAAYPAAAG